MTIQDNRPGGAPARAGMRGIDWQAMLMGLAFAAMWASAFSSARIIVAAAPPFTALALRFAISGLLAVGIALALGQRMDLTRRQWGLAAVFGICQNSLYLGFNFLAMTRIEAGLAAIIASLLPLYVAAAGWLILRERLPALGLGGLALGFAGVLMIMGARLSGGADPLGIGLALAGALALAAATLLMRGISPGDKLLMIVGLQMLVGAVTLAPAALIFESVGDISWSWPLALAFVYTLAFPGLLATVIWFRLVRRIGAVNAAAFHFLNPVLGIGFAALLLGESLSARDAVGVAVVTLGILLVQMARRPAAPPPPKTGG